MIRRRVNFFQHLLLYAAGKIVNIKQNDMRLKLFVLADIAVSSRMLGTLTAHIFVTSDIFHE